MSDTNPYLKDPTAGLVLYLDGYRLIRLPEVRRLTGLSTPTLYRQLGTGTFPAPVKIGARAVAWRLSDVIDFIEEREPTRPPAKRAPAE
ncbi:MAG: AlpA family phage regulatory protein [Reyranellaceae bacterium]